MKVDKQFVAVLIGVIVIRLFYGLVETADQEQHAERQPQPIITNMRQGMNHNNNDKLAIHTEPTNEVKIKIVEVPVTVPVHVPVPVPVPVPVKVPVPVPVKVPVPVPVQVPVPVPVSVPVPVQVPVLEDPPILGGKIQIQREGPWFFGTCTGTKGSGAWMREWLELQLLSGVDHVWVVNDNHPNSSDITGEVLKYYERLGFVTVIPGKMPKTHPGCKQLDGPSGVHNCVPPKYCFEHASPHVNWLLFADTDEFLFPHNGCSIKDHIKANCDPYQSHIYVRWERFGTSGFTHHPNGLMTENFLSSGGDCNKPGPFFDFFKGHCAKHPFAMCGECRHTKVILNSGKCATLDHAGWIHWPTNTTDWKEDMTPEKRKPHYKIWQQSEGKGAHWKSPNCTYTTDIKDQWRCEQWLTKGGGSLEKREYTSKCCTAGLGYNHYGTKSLQYYYKKKSTSVKSETRGFRAPLQQIDLNSTISFSVLRFARALRMRFKELGQPISDNVNFVDVEGGRSCFVEQNFKYLPDIERNTTTVTFNRTKTTAECCRYCHEEPECSGWTLTASERLCTLLLPASHVPEEVDPEEHRVSPFHLLGSRVWDTRQISGIPFRDGECLV